MVEKRILDGADTAMKIGQVYRAVEGGFLDAHQRCNKGKIVLNPVVSFADEL